MEKILDNYKALVNNLNNLSNIDINDYDLNKTGLFIVDMNNGFAKEGVLSSPRVEKIINPIADFGKLICSKINTIVAFTDTHNEDDVELKSYPAHCLRGDKESEIVKEILDINNIEILEKNSTNGFFVMNMEKYKNLDNFIVVGCCTDICVYQFVLTLKTYFNQNNLDKNIIVPVNLVETYDIDMIHSGDFFNTVFLNSMMQNGINVVKSILI
ncbi:isochorismatase family cysteine hydrolase [Terrisporobacter glycolicus]|uniref:isochorismatase family cysteine hydrolase n=1 Tax=Terrisporobacter glycolicus TaxID=36841 RepID=UPI003464824E